MLHVENNKKNIHSVITIGELLEKIKIRDEKYEI